MKYPYVAVCFFALAAGACASSPKPTLADEIQLSGFGSLSSDWRNANEDVLAAYGKMDEASNRVERGEKQVAQAEADIRRGESMILKGNRDKREAERAIARAEFNRDAIEAKYQSALDGAAFPNAPQ